MDSGERWLLPNAAQKPLRRWDGRNHRLVTHNQYDDGGKILETTRQFAIDYKNVVDWKGEDTVQQLQAECFVTTYQYDALDRVIAHTTPDGSTTLPTYNETNLLYSISVAKGVLYSISVAKGDTNTKVTTTNKTSTQTSKTGMFGEPVAEETEEDTTTYTKAVEGMIGEPVGDHEATVSVQSPNTNHPSPKTIVRNIDYNEKGQRTRIHYGNNIATKYNYAPNTFRLIELKSYSTKAGSTPPSGVGGASEVLQDLHYIYDPIGNITNIEDKAIPTQFFNNKKIEAQNNYTYDALYRLTKAEGREHIGQQNFGQNDNWQDLPFLQKYSGGDVMAWRTYNQTYDYDAVGNIHTMP